MARRVRINENLSIIAFDLGRNLGWASNFKGRLQWGSALFSEVRAHRLGEFLRMLTSPMWEAKIKRADIIVFETPFARGGGPTRSLWGMAGVLEAAVSETKRPVVDVSVATIKKFAADHGLAPKDEMIKAARRFGYKGKNDNEADAVCLLQYARANLERV
jgi:hypothetical protein